MKRTVSGAILVAVTALSLGGCFESEAEQEAKVAEKKSKDIGFFESENEKEAKIAEQKSKDFWDMGGPVDRSKSEGFKP